jgi:hypothetical protein
MTGNRSDLVRCRSRLGESASTASVRFWRPSCFDKGPELALHFQGHEP